MISSMPTWSSAYWENRYRLGGTSGAGSVGRLAGFKAATVNGLIALNNIQSVIDVGCGDASQLGLLDLPANYVGVDVSPAALALCSARFPERRFVGPEPLHAIPPAELTLALDVIYHLIEDAAFAAAIRTLFTWATRYVVIYASNQDASWHFPHVRHRRFTDHVSASQRDWRLLAHMPNPYPYDPANPDDTSFSDFYIYGRHGVACSILVPGIP